MNGIDFKKRKDDLGLNKRVRVKDKVAEAVVGPDFYTIRWKDKSKADGEITKGGNTFLYFEDHDNMVRILLTLGKIYVGELIPAQAIADELAKLHPDLNTKMLRPTGKYGKYYYSSLHLENYMQNIIYLRKGEVFLDEGFYKRYASGIPERPKEGVDKWI